MENDLLKIKQVRELIDVIDDQIVDLLDKRYYLIKEIGITKKQLNMGNEDKIREEQILNRLLGKNVEHMSKSLIIDLYNLIFKYSKLLK
jgi:chorismate mutase